MRLLRKKTRFGTMTRASIWIGIGSLLCCNCVRNEWIVDDDREGVTTVDGKYIVYFNPRLESNFTRALTPFPKGCYAQVYAFVDGQGNQSITSPVYESLSAGTLTPTQKPMLLDADAYDFYAVSLKADSLPPQFTNNTATDLYNGIDYLWCGLTDQIINASGTTIDLTFTHSATQFVFQAKNTDDHLRVDSIYYVGLIVPTVTNQSWDLTTGVISPSTQQPSDIQYLSVDQMTASGIFLPFNYDGPTLIAGWASNVLDSTFFFSVEIPPLETGYLGGHSYQYEILSAEDTITLGNIRVAPWIEK